MEIAKSSKQTDSLCKNCKHMLICEAWVSVAGIYDVLSCSKDPDKAKVDLDLILLRKALRRNK